MDSTATDNRIASQSPSGEHKQPYVATVMLSTDDNGRPLPGSALDDSIKDIHLPGFVFLTCLGVGGMGSVYLAKQESLNRYVAIKMLKNEFAHLTKYHARLIEEAKTMAALNHPNVISCYDIVSTPDHIFLIMEYIPGRLNARDLIQRCGPLDEKYVVKMLIDVVEGLAYVNQKGYIHQDLKPDNLMIYCENQSPVSSPADIFDHPENRIVIGDFGISRSVSSPLETDSTKKSVTIVGSPVYMPPEQYFTPDQIDFRADIYSLACTAYQLLTGRLPFDIEDDKELMRYKQNNGVPAPKSDGHPVSRRLSRIIMRMGMPLPEQRYPSYQDLLDDLKQFQAFAANHKPYSKKKAYNLGMHVAFGIIILLVTGAFTHNYIWKRYFTPIQVSLTQSLAFWEGISLNEHWRRMAPDIEVPHVYLQGMNAKTPIVLKRTLIPGDTVSFSVRFQGLGHLDFGLMTVNGENLMKVIWARAEGLKTSKFSMAVEQKAATDITEMTRGDARKWKSFQLQIDKMQAVILMNGKVLGVAHLRNPLDQCRFFIEPAITRDIELKEVYVEEASKTDIIQ